MCSGWIGFRAFQDFAIHSAFVFPLTGVRGFSSVDDALYHLKAKETTPNQQDAESLSAAAAET
jgi:hypothetical protein